MHSVNTWDSPTTCYGFLPGKLHKKKQNVLIVEDSKIFATAIKNKLEERFTFACQVVHTYKEAKQVVEDNDAAFFAAVLDLNLPDAYDGEIVDFIVSKKIPAVVLTATFSDDIRDRIISKNVVDYIIKEGPHSLDHLVNVLDRLRKNYTTKILLVDDSSVARKSIRRLLETQHFKVFEAKSGKEALEQLKKYQDIRMVITDYQMPEMDGFELTKLIRQQFPMNQLAVIGISGHGNSILSAKFLKKGANDFVVKPFGDEEFFWRINQNIEMLEYIESLKFAATRDYLTGLYNRRYFMDVGKKMLKNAARKHFDMAIAMLDIDDFKRINDSWGHDIGDQVLMHMARELAGHFRESDIIARTGGEEFCILTVNLKKENLISHFETLRADLEQLVIQTDGGPIRFTASIGVTCKTKPDLEQMIREADRLMYQAKLGGKNRVLCGV
jgi:diguanylate cyclase (GGDEF)-like protein